MITDREKWFSQRVGKTLYRTQNGCKCNICVNTYQNGLLIEDELHASYLVEIEHELKCTYYDSAEERDRAEQLKIKSDGTERETA